MIAAALATVVAAPPGRAQEVDPKRLAEVKAGFLLNFVRYTTWPEERLGAAGSPYRVVVIASPAVADQLEAIVRRSKATADDRGIEVTRIESVDRLSDDRRSEAIDSLLRSHAVFVGDAAADRAAMTLLPRLAAAGVLTVGDGAGFASGGGMIGLWRDGTRVVFDVNAEVIRSSPLVVSARVLKLARLVETGGGAE